MPATQITDHVGDELFISWTPDGGSAIDLSNFVSKFDPGFDMSTETNTAAGFALETEQAIREKIAPKMTLAARNSVAGAAARAALEQGTKGVLTWGLQGNGTGMPKYAAMLQVKKANTATEVGKIQRIEIDLVNIGSELVFDARLGDTF